MKFFAAFLFTLSCPILLAKPVLGFKEFDYSIKATIAYLPSNKIKQIPKGVFMNSSNPILTCMFLSCLRYKNKEIKKSPCTVTLDWKVVCTYLIK